MNKEEIYAIWADEASIWSRWVKPVFFAHLDAVPETGSLPAPCRWTPLLRRDTALVIEFPGADGIPVGLAAARAGYRPVPLYNALPLPTTEPLPAGCKPVCVVDVLPMLTALRENAQALATTRIPADAPPAFLLDAGRQGGRFPGSGEFDNRSVCFTTDFPSADFLRGQGIMRILLVQKHQAEPQEDLLRVLRLWKNDGIAIERMQIDPPTAPMPLDVAYPPWHVRIFRRVRSLLEPRPNKERSFGEWMMPHASGG